MKKFLHIVLLILFSFGILFTGCRNKNIVEEQTVLPPDADESFTGDPLFKLLSAEQTGVTFINVIEETIDKNFYKWMYFYNGGGVAAGDINNDGLADLYFTGNEVPDKLYLNLGNMKFEDISDKAGINKPQSWKTGVSMMDFNNDGFLDIYVCRSGWFMDENKRRNLLYVNNGDLTFTELGKEFGVDEPGMSVQAVYFDYDHDDDIDIYITNHPNDFISFLGDRLKKMENPERMLSDRLLRNDRGKFTDVSIEAGIKEYGHGLGPIVLDANQDGWDDIFVGNDFQTPDYLYINNKNGTFTDKVKEYFTHCSYYSMGVDLADIDFNGFLDLVCVEMLPENYRQEVLNLSPMTEKNKRVFFESGFYHQVQRNVLYLNNGNRKFVDIAQHAGVDATDWSWSPLFEDFDMDGKIDLFVSNGYYRETQNLDWALEAAQIAKANNSNVDIGKFKEKCPHVRIENFMYRGGDDLRFEKHNKRWGFEQLSFTSGAASVDLDNDGDLDLVMNNLDDPAFIYQNQSREKNQGNYVNIRFEGSTTNRFGLGAKVAVYTSDKRQFQILRVVRGFQSSCDYMLHFGLDNANVIDKIEITWNDGTQQELTNVNPNTLLSIKYTDAQPNLFNVYPSTPDQTWFADVTQKMTLNFIHASVEYDDYASEPLLPQIYSRPGPAIAVADVNTDHLMDFFVGNAGGKSSKLFIQKSNGSFIEWESQPWKADSLYACTDAQFFDADNDGDADLYLATGTNAYGDETIFLQDLLYINDGLGNFEKSQNALPQMITYSAKIDTCDFDKDGDVDLFIGGRLIPGHYGYAPTSYLLQNNAGVFTDITQTNANGLSEIGMVTDAVWADGDGDGFKDLFVVGEWMDITFFKNENGSLKKENVDAFEKTAGFWNTIEAVDVDKDGDQDFIAGNIGTNYRYAAASDLPLKCFLIDCFKNGKHAPFFARLVGGKYFPLRSIHVLKALFPEKFPMEFGTYSNYAALEVEEAFGKADKNLSAFEFQSVVILNNGAGGFSLSPLPVHAQLTSVNSILTDDFDKDGNPDLLIAGNIFDSPFDIYDANAGAGLLMLGNGKGSFEPLSTLQSGLSLTGEVRDMEWLPLKKDRAQSVIAVANRNAGLQFISQQYRPLPE